MDAIQRGYLRQLLFAMYLDPNKPRDVIECYTFVCFLLESNQALLLIYIDTIFTIRQVQHHLFQK